jgi:hypothetical protein
MNKKNIKTFFGVLEFSGITKGHNIDFSKGFKSQSQCVSLGQISSARGKNPEDLVFDTDSERKYHAVTWRRWRPEYIPGNLPQLTLTEFSKHGESSLKFDDYREGEPVCFSIVTGQGSKDRAGVWVLTEDFDYLDRNWIEVKIKRRVLYCGDRENLSFFLKDNETKLFNSMGTLKIKFWSIFKGAWDKPTSEEQVRFHSHLKKTFGKRAINLSPSLAPTWRTRIGIYIRRLFP